MTGSTVQGPPILSAKGAFALSAQPSEFLQRDIELSKNLEEQRRADFPSTMQWDGNGPPSRCASSVRDCHLRKGLPAVLIFVGDQRKNVLEFSQTRPKSCMPSATAREFQRAAACCSGPRLISSGSSPEFQRSYNEHRTHAGRAGRLPAPSPSLGGARASLQAYHWQPHCRGLYHTPRAA